MTGGPSRPRPRRCLPCWRCARPGSRSPPGTGVSVPPAAGGRCTRGSRSSFTAAASSSLDNAESTRWCGVRPLDTLPGRVIGAKPASVCRWSSPCLAPRLVTRLMTCSGSGAVTRAWTAYTSCEASSHGYAPFQTGADRRPRPRAAAITRRLGPHANAYPWSRCESSKAAPSQVKRNR